MSNKSELQSNNLDLQEVLETINSLPDANTVAPTNHASPDITYGIGTAIEDDTGGKYGHVKLSHTLWEFNDDGDPIDAEGNVIENPLEAAKGLVPSLLTVSVIYDQLDVLYTDFNNLATVFPKSLASYGTTDLTAGTSELATGKQYLVYE